MSASIHHRDFVTSFVKTVQLSLEHVGIESPKLFLMEEICQIFARILPPLGQMEDEDLEEKLRRLAIRIHILYEPSSSKRAILCHILSTRMVLNPKKREELEEQLEKIEKGLPKGVFLKFERGPPSIDRKGRIIDPVGTLNAFTNMLIEKGELLTLAEGFKPDPNNRIAKLTVNSDLINFCAGARYLRDINFLIYFRDVLPADINPKHNPNLNPAEYGACAQKGRSWLKQFEGTLPSTPHRGVSLLPPEVGSSERTHLNLSGYSLSFLPRKVDQTGVESVDLSDNKFRSIPDVLIRLRSVTKLNLAFNQIEAWPKKIMLNFDIRSLDLSHNQLRTLPEHVNFFFKLKYLNLSGNPLGVCPEVISQLPNLQGLSLRQTKLTTFPILPNLYLELLNLSDNHIEEVPESIKDLPKLKVLSLQGNPFSTRRISALAHFTSLTELNCDEALLPHLPPGFQNLSRPI